MEKIMNSLFIEMIVNALKWTLNVTQDISDRVQVSVNQLKK